MFRQGIQLIKPVLILEDDPEMQYRLNKILTEFGYEADSLTFVQSIQAAKLHIEQYSPELFLVDIGLPDGNGIEFIKIAHAVPDFQGKPIAVISAFGDAETIYQALSEGACSYVLKEKDDFDMMFAIRCILKGDAIIDPVIARKILEKNHLKTMQSIPRNNQETPQLSQRELEILACVSEGLISQEIAERLFISKFTVNVHIKNIYHKLKVKTRTQAVHFARESGLLT